MDQSNSEPFLHVANDKSVCKICNARIINKNEERVVNIDVLYKMFYIRASMVVKDLSTIRKHAFKWKTLNIPSEDRFADFCYAFDRIKDLTEGKDIPSIKNIKLPRSYLQRMITVDNIK